MQVELIFKRFLSKVRDPIFSAMDPYLLQCLCFDWLRSAAAEFQRVLLTDQITIDEEAESILLDDRFEPNRVCEILSLGMVVYWMSWNVFSAENMQNPVLPDGLRSFSPANLQKERMNTFGNAKKEFYDSLHSLSSALYLRGEL